MTWFGFVVVALLALKWLAQLFLEWLNAREVRRHSQTVPESLKSIVEPATFARSGEYTLAKSRLREIELTYSTLVLLVVLFSGVLPWSFGVVRAALGRSTWSLALVLLLIGVGLSLLDLPFDWHSQFRLEQRFGFNTTTPKLWWTDRLKGFCLAALLGYPLIVVILFLIQTAGHWWWLWAWAVLMCFQLVVAVLAPVVILPLFNKLTPLPEGSLRDRLISLAQRTHFKAKSIQVMDGSKRSRHSNAFFTGFGSFRRIVLFDTLVEQLIEPELEAVLAHEIGHFKRRHIPKMLCASALGSLVGFYVLAWFVRQEWFYRSFGFSPGNVAAAMLLFGLLSSTLTFWGAPLLHWWSRRYEYQADRFAAQTIGQAAPLISALRKLNEKNLSNLTPHRLYSGFYYSHPTLLEREHALSTAGRNG
jgi:STE24 endopeptidase